MKRRWPRILLTLSLIVNLLCASGSVAVVIKQGGRPWLTRKLDQLFHPQQAKEDQAQENDRTSVFAQLSIGPNDIVFLGDSILNFGEWHELLNDERAKNRAIAGDDTHTILNRLDQIIRGIPRHVVFLCGINNFQKGVPYPQTTREYAQIVTRISSQSPHTEMWLLPVLPVNTWLYQEWFAAGHLDTNMPKRTEVEKLNSFIKTLAVNRPLIHFVDMPELLNRTGELGEDYTIDGLHLNGRGLKEIATRLKQLGILSRSRVAALAKSGHPNTSEGGRRRKNAG